MVVFESPGVTQRFEPVSPAVAIAVRDPGHLRLLRHDEGAVPVPEYVGVGRLDDLARDCIAEAGAGERRQILLPALGPGRVE